MLAIIESTPAFLRGRRIFLCSVEKISKEIPSKKGQKFRKTHNSARFANKSDKLHKIAPQSLGIFTLELEDRIGYNVVTKVTQIAFALSFN